MVEAHARLAPSQPRETKRCASLGVDGHSLAPGACGEPGRLVDGLR